MCLLGKSRESLKFTVSSDHHSPKNLTSGSVWINTQAGHHDGLCTCFLTGKIPWSEHLEYLFTDKETEAENMGGLGRCTTCSGWGGGDTGDDNHGQSWWSKASL